MPSPTKPLDDHIQRVNDDVAVGSDLEFQRKWWRFERFTWAVLVLLVAADLLGFFGRGYFAKSRVLTSDGSMQVQYERVERAATPSILMVQFGPSAIHDGRVQLWASETLVKQLGAQRVIPQPLSSVIGEGGILYTFEATKIPASVAFALDPPGPGICKLSLHVPGFEEKSMRVVVMP
jgi:hypothetical protein